MSVAVESFQSTLPRGERLYRTHQAKTLDNFNPRSREGSDVDVPSSVLDNGYFNPRSREGSDCNFMLLSGQGRDFNPRSREGSDVYIYNTLFKPDNFNPRSREGSDIPVECSCYYLIISIHAPARGATDRLCGEDVEAIISIHAPARGATLDSLAELFKDIISIHAPARGATANIDKYTWSFLSIFTISNHAPRKESDHSNSFAGIWSSFYPYSTGF